MIVRIFVVLLLAFTCAACDSDQTPLVGEYSICWIDLPEDTRLCRATDDRARSMFSSASVVAAGYSNTHIGLQTCGPDGIQHYSVERDYTTSDRFLAIGPIETAERVERRMTSPEQWPEYSYRSEPLGRRLCEVGGA
ncbi:hypothetical protein [Hyphobacterium sp.]|uniref:hypothetical protein n=1 Tax=Hyphobacterium sp. TaxID=2004662 RepID=UPI00374902F6